MDTAVREEKMKKYLVMLGAAVVVVLGIVGGMLYMQNQDGTLRTQDIQEAQEALEAYIKANNEADWDTYCKYASPFMMQGEWSENERENLEKGHIFEHFTAEYDAERSTAPMNEVQKAYYDEHATAVIVFNCSFDIKLKTPVDANGVAYTGFSETSYANWYFTMVKEDGAWKVFACGV